MVKRTTFIKSNNLIDSPFFKTFAINYLAYLGNSNPTHKQLNEIQDLLAYNWVRLPVCFDLSLTALEKQCLYLSAQGKGLKEIAAFLSVSVRRVTQYRQSIFRKLSCDNITSAVIVGLRFGVVKADELFLK